MNFPKRYQLITFIFLVILTTHFGSVTSQFDAYDCSNQQDYAGGSLYRDNLNSLFLSLSSNIGNTGFYNTSMVNQVNAIALCRGDILPDNCRNCIEISANEIFQLCPSHLQAIRWSEHCMLRYSDVPIFGTLATSPAKPLRNINNTTSPDRFMEVRRMLIDELRGKAANGGALRKAAAESRAGPDNQTIFAMVQCTPDLSAENCTSCLVQAEQYILDQDLNGSTWKGMIIYLPSCMMRYETYPFYNITRLQEPLEQPSSPSSPSSGKHDDNTTRNIIIIVISTLISLIIALWIGIFTIKKIKGKTKETPNTAEDISTVEDTSTAESIQYDFGQIRAATNDFSNANKLGQGGFGAVYKGKLVNGREIAVKRLSRNLGQGDLEFKNEVLLVARLQHRNLVRLLGFSIEGSERLLVYEFHENGSLDHFIFDPIKSSNLSWEMRYKIIRGIARGLLYLHEDSRLRIIHRDLKASNILLDEEMNPKISDFGMAKLIMPNTTQESTSRVVGTHGYMAPEYATYGQFSIKSDVYSFGVLVLEIISGQKIVHFQSGENSEGLLIYAWRSWRKGSTTNLIDPVLRATSGSQLDTQRCIHIALLCVQENVADRPTMASVIQMLNSFSSTLSLPSEPAFYVPSNFSEASSLLRDRYNSKEESSSSSKDKLAYSSNYDFSITKLFPR